MTCWSSAAATPPCARRSRPARRAPGAAAGARPTRLRGGNSRHTRNLRCMHERRRPVLTDAYPEDEFWDDLLARHRRQHRRASGAPDDPRVAERARLDAAARRALPAVADRHAAPVAHQRVLPRRRQGAGERLLPHRRAAGRRVLYDAEVDGAGARRTARSRRGRRRRTACRADRARALRRRGAGGFEANLRLAARVPGATPADNFLIRGTPLQSAAACCKTLLDQGADAVGDPTQCHAVALDARAPKFDGGIVTRLDCVPFGIVVNRDGERFYDEGEDFWPKRYAIWGRLVAQQPGPDRATRSSTRRRSAVHAARSFRPIAADTLARARRAAWARCRRSCARTVASYNAAVRPGTFDHAGSTIAAPRGSLRRRPTGRGRSTRRRSTAIRCGPASPSPISASRVNEQARRCIMEDGRPAGNLFAAGEIMAGNILGQGYLAGFGMTIGTVFGRIAGQGGGARMRETEAIARSAARSWRSATPAATAKASARSSRRWSCGATSPRPT